MFSEEGRDQSATARRGELPLGTRQIGNYRVEVAASGLVTASDPDGNSWYVQDLRLPTEAVQAFLNALPETFNPVGLIGWVEQEW